MNPTQNSEEENKLTIERRKKLDYIRKNSIVNGHPNDFRRDSFASDLKIKFSKKTKEELEELNHRVAIAGRIMAKRGPFLVIREMSDDIQVYTTKSIQKKLKKKYQNLDIGDIIGIKGVLNKSRRGDLYVSVENCFLLTKSLRPLPEKFYGLTDQETRYRQRYVDLIINKNSRRTFRIRSKLIAAIRSFMLSKDYIEVETPTMQVVPGGATARPFTTHHNALNMDMYLRIAPELYLKRLVVGGFERVFEIGRNFRNEGLSPYHNPEFTMIEFYQAYSDYKDLMLLTENMLSSIAIQVLGSTSIRYGTTTIELGGTYAQMSMFEAIKLYNQDHIEIQNLVRKDLQNHKLMISIAKLVCLHTEEQWTCGQILEKIFSETTESQLIQPTFITNYPAEISPLARKNDKDSFFSDRFELFIGGYEIANGFSELNDAEDQDLRFKKQHLDKQNTESNETINCYDKDYITALEYGLPPTAGQGIGIDRLTMLFTNTKTIRDVILFPSMRAVTKA
ncbi:lysine--tRNA ligase [Candidatus Photodesmus blepharus]